MDNKQLLRTTMDAEKAIKRAREEEEEELKKKRPKYAPLDRAAKVSSSTARLPSLAIQERMFHDKWVPLWPFTQEGLRLTGTSEPFSLQEQTFKVTTEGNLISADVYVPHAREKSDEELSQVEFLEATTGYISALQAFHRESAYIEDFLKFSSRMVQHPYAQLGELGRKIIMAYVAAARKEQAREAFFRGKACSLANINEEKLQGFYDRFLAEG